MIRSDSMKSHASQKFPDLGDPGIRQTGIAPPNNIQWRSLLSAVNKAIYGRLNRDPAPSGILGLPKSAFANVVHGSMQ